MLCFCLRLHDNHYYYGNEYNPFTANMGIIHWDIVPSRWKYKYSYLLTYSVYKNKVLNRLNRHET